MKKKNSSQHQQTTPTTTNRTDRPTTDDKCVWNEERQMNMATVYMKRETQTKTHTKRVKERMKRTKKRVAFRRLILL